MSKTITTVRMHADRTLHRVLPDGTEEPMPAPPPLLPMTEEETHAAALSDPDAEPLTEDDLARIKPIPRYRHLRRRLGLTQEEFALRFHIPVGTLRDWEQGRTEPDQTARAYLRAIAGNAEAVRQALEMAPRRPEHPSSMAG